MWERERERDGQFKCIKFNLSYSFPLITPPLWTGIWFSQVLLNWLLRFEWESNNMRTHTPKPFLHIFFLCRYEQRYLSPSCSHLSWWPWGHCPCLWSLTAAKEPLCNQHSSRQTIVVCVCVCVCTLAELTMSPVGNFKEWTLQRPIKAAKHSQRVNIWLIPQHSCWELTHSCTHTQV